MKQFNNLSIYQCSNVRGFTLLEITVALIVFALVVVASGATFISVHQSWQRQRDTLDLIQNARWAMDFMCSEIRGAGQILTPPPDGDRMRFRISSTQTVEYRRQGTVLRRRVGSQPWHKLANFVVNNPENRAIFRRHPTVSNLYIIELTIKKNNRQYTLRSQVRPRN